MRKPSVSLAVVTALVGFLAVPFALLMLVLWMAHGFASQWLRAMKDNADAL